MYSDGKVISDFSIVLVFCLFFCRRLLFFGDKIGYRKEVCHFYSRLCEFGRRLEGGSGGIGNTLYLLRVDYGWFCRCTAGKNPSFEGWKNEIATFIKEERIDSPILVGHSMGGGLALAVAADFPTLVGKIVIVDALPCLMALTHPDFNPVADKDCSDMITRITAMNHEQFVRMQRMSVASLTTDSLKFDEIVEWGAASDRKTYAAMYCDFANTDLRERIRSIAVPVLVLLEPHFKNIASIVNEQYRNLHGVRLRYAEQGLHFMMFDDKEWFMNELTGFIKE